ncbi:hypothetical protein EAS64_25790 [Trebonia kvetii]|uniref:Uncharacterized protein n=1 Tax=Trebonia kvetii TaxID=2480626 RepID=A0A6P2BU64_9ACTN|nr:hypothetical protein [Trebonia kvetii]TVZ02237.1 hypothetical protein EAS64_25790 [Trebonia kvetii]
MAKPPDPAGDELIQPDGLAADHVERIARDPAGGSGDDGTEVGLLDQRVDVDALNDDVHVYLPEQAVQVDPVQRPFDVDPVQHGVQVDPVQQSIHIQRGNDKLDRTVRNGLGLRLHPRAKPVVHRAQSRKRVHAKSVAVFSRARITP